MVCFRCDGKGKYRNEFGLLEKCESCQKKDMAFEKVNPEPDSNEEGYWISTKPFLGLNIRILWIS